MKKIFLIMLLFVGALFAQTEVDKDKHGQFPSDKNFAKVAPMIYFNPADSNFYYIRVTSSGYIGIGIMSSSQLDSILENIKEGNSLFQQIENAIDAGNIKLDTIGDRFSQNLYLLQKLREIQKAFEDTTKSQTDRMLSLLQNIRARVDTIQYGSASMISATLDDDPTSSTSSGVKVGNKNKISFILAYDETEVGNSVSGTVTIEVSPDNTNWYAYDILYDHTGSIVSNIVYTSDANDVFYLPELVTFPYLRVKFTGTNTDADDTILITVIMCWQGK